MASVSQIYKLDSDQRLVKSSVDVEEVLHSNAFLRGDSLFTSMYVENGKFWFLDDHILRLSKSLESYEIDDLGSLIETIKGLEYFPHSYLRITFFETQKDRYFWIKVLESPDPRRNKHKVVLISFQRSINNEADFKWGNYLESQKIKREHDFGENEDILFINGERVLECSTSNIFFSDGKKLYTPKLGQGVLNGTYRKNLIKIYGDKIVEKDILVSKIKDFKNAWVTSGIKGIRIVSKIDNLDFDSEQWPFGEEIVLY